MSDRKKIQVIIDSTVDMADRLKDRVKTVPLIVSFGDREYLDGIDLSRDDFYRELEAVSCCPKPASLPRRLLRRYSKKFMKAGRKGL